MDPNQQSQTPTGDNQGATGASDPFDFLNEGGDGGQASTSSSAQTSTSTATGSTATSTTATGTTTQGTQPGTDPAKAPPAPAAIDPNDVAARVLAQLNGQNQQRVSSEQAEKQWTDQIEKLYEPSQEDKDNFSEAQLKSIKSRQVAQHKAVVREVLGQVFTMAPQIFHKLYGERSMADRQETAFFGEFPQLEAVRDKAEPIIKAVAHAMKQNPETAKLPQKEFMELVGITACGAMKLDITPKSRKQGDGSQGGSQVGSDPIQRAIANARDQQLQMGGQTSRAAGAGGGGGGNGGQSTQGTGDTNPWAAIAEQVQKEGISLFD